MAKCSFCGKQVETGTGVVVIRNDGKILRFDSMKCEKSMTLFGRDPRDVKWISKADQK